MTMLIEDTDGLVREGNDTREARAAASPLDLFAAWVERTPDAVAVAFGPERLTYRELDLRSRRLARRLRALGVGPEQIVGLGLERTPELAVAVLGVLRAGGAYLPLPPDYPRERLALMMADAGVRRVLTTSGLAGRLPLDLPPDGLRTLLLDGPDEEESGAGPDLPASDPRRLAYVIFTSGSTGRPKGVLVEHRGVPNLVLAQGRAFDVRPGDRVLQLAAFGFDASVSELWMALGRGAAAVFAGREDLLPGPRLIELLRREAITHVTVSPSALAVLTPPEPAPLPELPDLRTLIVAGEACPAELARRWAAGRRFVNAYGPTEATVCATLQVADGREDRLPIGRPIPNVRAWNVDVEEGGLAPAGASGELWLGGVGLARGYLGRPDLTAERFVPDPFGDEPGARLYRTGDLCRRTPDGRLEFLGRIDQQVKVRGFRIELGEIEAVLARQPAVSDAAVLALPGGSSLRLVAWTVPADPAAPPAPAELRAALARELPEHMIPSRFLLLDRLPLTAQGKVDRLALASSSPGLEDAGLPGVDGDGAARTPTEEQVAAVWAELLGSERVGRNEDLFDLGADSLLAARFLARMRDAFRIDLPLRALFETPTVAALAERIDETLAGEGLTAMPPLAPHPRQPGEPVPASFAQERLWLVDRLTPDRAIYGLPSAVRLSGALDLRALESALGEIERRHEALRTVLVETEGGPRQVVRPFSRRPLPVYDLGSLAPEERDAEVRRWLDQEARRPFDLARGPLFRRAVLRLGADESVLWLDTHHIVSDGWSAGVLDREIAILYEAFSRGLPSPLPELPIQYADYALWQREWLAGDVLGEQIAWWRRELEGAPELLELPADRPRPAAQSFRGAARTRPLPADLARAVKTLGRESGTTPFLVLLAAFETLLHRLSGQREVVVGIPVANRNHRALEGLIGFFVNTLVLRGRFEREEGGEVSFRELLERVRAAALGAWAHQDLPFERLVEELRVERSLSHNPLFQVTFAVEGPRDQGLDRAGLEARPLEARSAAAAKFDLVTTVQESAGGLEGPSVRMEYATDLFDGTTVERWLGHLEVLLAGLTAAPDLPVSALPLLRESELRQLVTEWNDTRSGYPRAACVHELVEEQARRTPDAPALVELVEGGRTLTYRDLDQRAARLAARLRRLGVGPDVPVTFALERSAGMIVTLLAILKAGGAYAPLDLASPRERLAGLMERLASPVLVTEPALLDRLPPAPGEVLLLEPDGEAGEESEAAPQRAGAGAGTGPDNLAYVLFTSGTTGTPKGVAVPHRAVVRLVRDANFARMGPDDVFLQLAPVAFDASTLEIWGALANGATLAIHPPSRPSLEELAEVIARHRVSILWLTAGLFHQMVEHDARAFAPVRQLLAGGDVVSAAHVRRVLEAVPGIRVINGYGPTENTTFTCCRPASDPDEVGTPFPIGRPISGSRALLLDAAMRPVPIGVAGELYAGGDGLARGYLALPGLTAAAFVPDPYGEPGGRLYRTGDLARWLAAGEIEFLGRRDGQVKVRGFRIEVGEIEAVLASHAGVAAAAVLPRRESGDLRLAAFVVARPGAVLAAADLRAFLHERLPEPMVPSLWGFLDSLPLTANGKVDRAALAERPIEPERQEGALQPRTSTEEILAEIWAELLGVPRPGVRDNFFALGGHSLLATRLLSRVRERFGLALPLRVIFDLPTIESLAAELDREIETAEIAAPPIARVPRPADGRMPASFAQGRLWFLDRLTPGLGIYNVSCAFRARGGLDLAALEFAWNALVERHESLRTTFSEEAGAPVQVVHPFSPRTMEVAGLAGEPEAWRRLEEEADRPFDLARGPLIRFGVLRLEETAGAVLWFVLHHIVCDGWSIEVLVRELGELYAARLAGRPARLAEPPVQYPDFAAWQTGWLRGDALAREVAWWRHELAGAPTLLELPADRPRPLAPSFRGAQRATRLPAALARAVHELGRASGATPFLVLLAAFEALLHRLTGQSDVLVGAPIANRNHREIEGLIGFFVNTLVLRGRFLPDEGAGPVTFRGLLERVRRNALGAYAHQDLPFERLVEELRIERNLSYNPLFQVTFALQTPPGADLALPGVALELLDLPVRTAKFDLSLTFWESLSGDGGLDGRLEYATDLFDAPTAERLLGQLGTLLAGLTAAPGLPVESLPLLSEPERQQAVTEWNDTASGYPRDRGVHELVEEHARRTPEKTAVVDGERAWSYAELDRRAERLAGRLRRLGVGPEVPATFALERSAEMIVTLLAILKAGGAYAPLDPAHPRERLAWLIGHLGSPVLITSRPLLDRLPEIPAGTAVVLAEEEIEEAPAPPRARVEPDNLALILFTSGTTGMPKGVALPHRGVLRMVRDVNYARLAADEVFLQLAPIAFDASTFEIWGALANGATLVIYPSPKPSIEELREVLARHRVSTLFVTAGLFHQLVEQDVRALAPVRHVMTGGDVVSAPHSRAVLEALPGIRVTNCYGPTENSTFVSFRSAPDPAELGATFPIGRPVSGSRALLLDAAMQPVPAGVVGDLYAAGDGLARGYLHRPDLTAAVFVPNPWGEPGSRLYRTGDLARWVTAGAAGELDFLGRRDAQVKIRGFRIEMTEIEAALASHPALAESTVVVRKGPGGEGDKRLVAFVVAKPGEEPSAAELRAFLQERLPEAMVPAQWAFLERLPLTPNGKVDRRALDALEGEHAAAAGERLAPRTATEEAVAGIWAALLGHQAFGVRDDFFELGGHSLLATRLISRVRDAFGVELRLSALFARPTVEAVAAELDAAGAVARTAAEPARSAAGLRAREREGTPLALSFAQERLWFLDRLTPGLAVYNVPIALRLSGRLDLDALARSLSEVVRRHEALRTTFTVAGEAPVQIVHPFEPLPLPVADLAGLPPETLEDEARRRLDAAAAEPFDLEHGPVFRALLLRLAPEESRLLLAMHHIVSDGWSVDVLLREIATLYAAFSEGRPSPLPELPQQYADFAAWHREWLRGPVLDEQLAFWRDELAGAPLRLDLPADRPRPPVQRFRGGRHLWRMPEETLGLLRAFARDRGATPFSVVLAAFDMLLWRYTGQDDLLLGAPVAGRNDSLLEDLIGFFVNTVVLRARVQDDSTFAGLLDQLRSTTARAFSHQDLPFERLVDELAPERDLSHSPVFQVMLAYHRAAEAVELPGLTLAPVEVDVDAAKFDLLLGVAETERELTALWQYDADLFDAWRIERMAGHFETLLAGALAEPDARLSDLPLLSAAERDEIRAWNSWDADYAGAPCVHELIEAQVERTPDAVALVFEGAALTYRELDDKASRLAAHLRRLGVTTDHLVGISAERSLELLVGLIGILKAGGAYVPIDPSLPADRQAYMAEDSGVDVVLTQRALRDEASWGDDRLPHGSSGSLPDSLAYLIYTSGSTGRPKGAANAHHAIRNRLLWGQATFELKPEDRVLQKTPFSFDVSVWELFWPLIVGARLVIAKPGGHQDPGYLVDLIEREGITTVHFVPSMLRAFLETPGLERCRTVRRALASGEALPPDLTALYFERMPGELNNLYGPTEAAVEVTWWRCRPGEKLFSVPIGRPIANTQIWLRDRSGNEVPVGIPGELLIAGVQPARGYHRRPELTAEKFIPDEGSRLPGMRAYRSGDLARWRPDGAIEYLGRIDHQVKIRGFRIELGEIESALIDQPAIQDAVVMARTQGKGEPRLVAWVVPSQAVEERETWTESVRAGLRQRLPDYMVPAAFVLLDSMPLNPNGKVDRKALPEPDAALDAARVWEEPATDLERYVADLFAGLLSGVLGGEGERIGRRDSFFELGGNSVTGAILINRLQRALGEPVPVMVLFEVPNVADLAERIERDHPAAVARLLGRDASEAIEGTALDEIPRLERGPGVELPLSFSQERLWFLDRLAPGQSVYNMPLVLRFRGALDTPALAGAVAALVRRHEPLRATFATTDHGPRQIIHPAPSRPLPEIDLRALPASLREDEAERVLVAESRRPFDLEHGPLLRATLVRLSDAPDIDAALLLCMHHTASDGWSFRVVVSDLAALYPAALEGKPDPLPELPVRYADFAAWQRRRLDGPEGERQLSYWSEALRGAPTRLDLPADRPRPPVQRFRGAIATRPLPESLARAARELARQSSATPFMLLLAGFQALLHRYTGQDDILVGTPVSGRGRRELEAMVGLFVNTLVMRGRMSDGQVSFRTLLERNRDATMRGLDHQELPFERLVDELAPERDLSQSPLFQVMFVLNEGPGPVALPGVTATPSEVDIAAAKFDLLLAIAESEQDLTAYWSYDADLFDAWRIERMAGHFEILLAAALADPARRLADLPLLTAAEQEELRAWNSWTADYEGAPCLHELIEAQVERTPDAVALVFEGATLTYRELDDRASRLAAWLRRQGATTDRLVGISAERSFELLVGLIGILKAGGAYVPIDPSLPADRQAYMAEDSGVQVVLTQAILRDEAAWGDERLPHGSSEARPESLAYLIYTSGSTGRPKGAANAHHAIRNRLLWGQATFDLKPEDRVLQKTPFSFDVSVWELFWPLIVGARLVIARPGGHQDPGYLADLIEREGITTIHFVPSMLRAFLETPGLERCRTIRRAVCSGEALPPDLARLYFERMPGELHNLYGPTEAAVEVTWWPCRPADRLSNVPIGRPIANTQIWLLDRHGWPVPAGVPGELLIAGVQPARGYHRRPELTAEKFVPDAQSPVLGAWGARCYRSGDLARWRPDGAIEYLGRIDHQVKIRGFRIELGEIESALADQPGARESVVVAQSRGQGDPRLVAYVVSAEERPDREAWFDELRTGLRERLPDYMVPPVFVLLEALPLNPNGKVDRKALPEPERAGAGADTERLWEEPATELERYLAALFAELLRLPEDERVGRRDSFFELGGNSVTGAILINRLQRVLGEPVPVVVMFEAPTVADLAARLELDHPGAVERLLDTGRGAEAPEVAAAAIPRVAHGPDTEIPLSFSQERLWFVDQLDPGNPSSNVFAPLRLTGLLDVAALAATLTEMVRRHEVLRTTFGSREGKPYQRIAPPSPQPLPLVDLSILSAADADAEELRLARAEGLRGFELAHGPVLRTTLVRLGASSWILLLNMHHVVSDGWSLGVIVEELGRLYESFSRNRPLDLPELPIQMADFASWQRGWLQGERLEQEVEWWRGELSGAPLLLDLPLDRPRPPAHQAHGAHLDLKLPRELSRSVAALGQRHGATLFMTLLAAFDLLMHRLSGQDDLVVGTPVAGRNRAEVEPMIGCFINTLALRSRLDSSATFADLLRQTRGTTLGAFTHQDLPFERVVDGLQVPRNLSHTPVYQVLFALQNTPMGKLEMGGLGIELIDLETDSANFALSLGLVEGEDGLWGVCIYDTDLLDAATVERWMAHYRDLLAWAVDHAERPLSELPPLAEPPRRVFAPVAAAEPEADEDAARARLAAREEGVEEMRAGLSDKKRAALEKLRGRLRKGGS
jgi:amino acid adenylation domain-containing protein